MLGMPGPGSRLPDGALTLRFMGSALVALVAFQALLVFWAPEVTRHFLMPRTVTLVHLAALGWITTVMMGALYQLAPVIFQTRLAWPRLARAQFWIHLVGVAGLVWSFGRGLWTPGLAGFGALVVGSVILFAAHMGVTLRRRTVWNNTGWFVAHALAFLALTVGMGLAFALDLRYGWWPLTPRLLATHAHLGLVGWFTYLLMGVSYRLIPMFTVVHGHGEGFSRWVMRLLNVGMLGVLLVFPHTAAGRVWVLATAGLLAAGSALYAVDIARLYRRRTRRALDVTQHHMLAAVGALLLATGLGLRIAAGFDGDGGALSRWTLAYGYTILAGWLSLAIMGHYYKIIPFLVWQRRYRPQAGRGPAPLFRDLYDERLARAAFWTYLAGFLVTATGLWLGAAAAVQAGAAVGLVGVGGFALTASQPFWRTPPVRREVAPPVVREGV
ncbi:MAG TPA: hypothetical protein VIO14_03170 [Dehalococcoidia bacterium]